MVSKTIIHSLLLIFVIELLLQMCSLCKLLAMLKGHRSHMLARKFISHGITHSRARVFSSINIMEVFFKFYRLSC